MINKKSKWMLKQNKADIKKLSESCGINPFIANVLANRGIANPQSVNRFLYSGIKDMYPSFLMKDLDKGCQIIKNGIESNKRILIYGDYDADGIMSTCILYKGIKALGGNVSYMIPDRISQGYGLNEDVIDEIGNKADILLTCDNGISSLKEVEKANNIGLQTVIIDHHEPPIIDGEEILPKAEAVIDPKQSKCEYPFKFLCGAGLSFKFIENLFRCMGKDFYLLDELVVFAAIATVCDVVDLLDENRIIVKYGLEKIKSCTNLGIKKLLKVLKISADSVNEYHFGFLIGPCINAVGRLEKATKACRLFLTESDFEAENLANEVVILNELRKNLTEEGEKAALRVIEENDYQNDKVLVLYCPDVNESVAGIVAGWIKDRFYKPTIVLTGKGEIIKASARSIESYNIFDELSRFRDYFIKFGGHSLAAGFSMKKEFLSTLREGLKKNCRLGDDCFVPVYRIESELKLHNMDIRLAKDIENLSPFGKSNEMPLFGTKKCLLEKITFMGKDKKFMRLSLFDETKRNMAIGVDFNGYDKMKELIIENYDERMWDRIVSGEKVWIYMDILFSLNVNVFNGRESLQLMIKDFRF